MVYERMRDFLAEQLEIEPEKISPDSEVIKDLGADSLDVAEFMINIEDEYNITINEDEIEGILTIGKFAEYIESLIK